MEGANGFAIVWWEHGVKLGLIVKKIKGAAISWARRVLRGGQIAADARGGMTNDGSWRWMIKELAGGGKRCGVIGVRCLLSERGKGDCNRRVGQVELRDGCDGS